MPRCRCRNAYLAWAILGTIFVLYTVLEHLTPFEYDNFMFDNIYRATDAEASPLARLVQYVAYIRLNDNMRLANILAPVTTQMMPYWLFSVLTGLCVALFTGLCAYIARGRLDTAAVTAAWLACTLFLPWRNKILTGDFALNYIYASAVAMAFVAALLSAMRHGDTWRTLLAAVLAILTGAWHEGFALPLVAGVAAWALLQRGRIVHRTYLLAALLLATTLAIFLCPGMMERVTIYTTLRTMSMKRFCLNNCLTLMLCLTAAVMALRRNGRHRLAQAARDPVIVILGGAALAGMVLCRAIGVSDRVAWAPQLFAIVVWMRILLPLYDTWWRPVRVAVVTVALLLTTAHGLHAIYWQYRLGKQFNEVMARVHALPGTTVFHDLIPPEDVPVTTLYFPSHQSFTDPVNYIMLATDNRYRGTAVVPQALNTDLSTTGTPFGSVMQHQGHLFVRQDGGATTMLYFTLTLKDGRTLRGYPVFALPFTDAAGHRYTYLIPYNISPRDIADIR